jgi:hypothetical protein
LGFVYRGERGLGLKIDYLKVVPTIRMGGAILLLPQYSFMAWTETTE